MGKENEEEDELSTSFNDNNNNNATATGESADLEPETRNGQIPTTEQCADCTPTNGAKSYGHSGVFVPFLNSLRLFVNDFQFGNEIVGGQSPEFRSSNHRHRHHRFIVQPTSLAADFAVLHPPPLPQIVVSSIETSVAVAAAAASNEEVAENDGFDNYYYHSEKEDGQSTPPLPTQPTQQFILSSPRLACHQNRHHIHYVHSAVISTTGSLINNNYSAAAMISDTPSSTQFMPIASYDRLQTFDPSAPVASPPTAAVVVDSNEVAAAQKPESEVNLESSLYCWRRVSSYPQLVNNRMDKRRSGSSSGSACNHGPSSASSSPTAESPWLKNSTKSSATKNSHNNDLFVHNFHRCQQTGLLSPMVGFPSKCWKKEDPAVLSSHQPLLIVSGGKGKEGKLVAGEGGQLAAGGTLRHAVSAPSLLYCCSKGSNHHRFVSGFSMVRPPLSSSSTSSSSRSLSPRRGRASSRRQSRASSPSARAWSPCAEGVVGPAAYMTTNSGAGGSRKSRYPYSRKVINSALSPSAVMGDNNVVGGQFCGSYADSCSRLLSPLMQSTVVNHQHGGQSSPAAAAAAAVRKSAKSPSPSRRCHRRSSNSRSSSAARKSPLKIGKRKPRKKVAFADDKGMKLVEIRTIKDAAEPILSPVMQGNILIGHRSSIDGCFHSMSECVFCPFPALSVNCSADGDGSSQSESSRRRWTVNFMQPACQYVNFIRNLERNKVSLENVTVRHEQCSIFGTVKVKNLSYKKEVFIRFTMNSWQSYTDQPAHYSHSDGQPSSSTPNLDTFTFEIKLPPSDFCCSSQQEDQCNNFSAAGFFPSGDASLMMNHNNLGGFGGTLRAGGKYHSPPPSGTATGKIHKRYLKPCLKSPPTTILSNEEDHIASGDTNKQPPEVIQTRPDEQELSNPGNMMIGNQAADGNDNPSLSKIQDPFIPPASTASNEVLAAASSLSTTTKEINRVEFAVCYRSVPGGAEHWDNNGGSNYAIIKPSPIITSPVITFPPSSSPSTTISTSVSSTTPNSSSSIATPSTPTSITSTTTTSGTPSTPTFEEDQEVNNSNNSSSTTSTDSSLSSINSLNAGNTPKNYVPSPGDGGFDDCKNKHTIESSASIIINSDHHHQGGHRIIIKPMEALHLDVLSTDDEIDL